MRPRNVKKLTSDTVIRYWEHEMPTGEKSPGKKTHHPAIGQYQPSKTYFARIRINGKLIRRKLKATYFLSFQPRLIMEASYCPGTYPSAAYR